MSCQYPCGWCSSAGSPWRGAGMRGVCVREEQCPRLQKAKTEGQSSLITTLKHDQHLFRPKTTLSLGINLLNCWIVTLSRGKVGQEPVCQGSSEGPSKPYFTANSVRRPGWAFTAYICVGNTQTMSAKKLGVLPCDFAHLFHSRTNAPRGTASEKRIYCIWTSVFPPNSNETRGRDGKVQDALRVCTKRE